jgi:hypothetical protein
MIDRLVHHADVVNLKGDSYRRPGPFLIRRDDDNTTSRIAEALRPSLETAYELSAGRCHCRGVARKRREHDRLESGVPTSVPPRREKGTIDVHHHDRD